MRGNRREPATAIVPTNRMTSVKDLPPTHGLASSRTYEVCLLSVVVVSCGGHCFVPGDLAAVQRRIPPPILHQFMVRAVLANDPVVKYEDVGRALESREPVSYHYNRTVLLESLDSLLNMILALGIEGACRFIEEHNRRILQYRSGHGYSLPLAS